MKKRNFNEELLADILAFAVVNEFCDYENYTEICNDDDDKIAELTKKDIIQLAKDLLPEEVLNSYPAFEQVDETKTMTIQESFLAKEKEERDRQHQKRIAYARTLGENINKALLEPKFIQKVTPLLKEHGRVSFSDVGCLCQSGVCSDQQGFTDYCKKAIDFWEKEGVYVIFSIESGLSVKRESADLDLSYYPNVKLYSND